MQSESKIQQQIVQWFNNTYCLVNHTPRYLILHIPNEGKDNGKLVSVGLYPGAADLLIVANGITYFVEVKEPLKGKQSPNQSKFENHCNQSGITYCIVFSLEEFKKWWFEMA